MRLTKYRAKACALVALALILSPFSVSAGFSRPLTLGSTGSDVSELQQFLKDRGFFSFDTITGFFGPITKDALIRFQTSVGLEGVGQVGPKTLAVLNGSTTTTISATFGLLSVGATGSDVSALQQLLKDKGFYTYPTITGYYGPITEAAVKAFQIANGLEGVGYVGPQTHAKLTELVGTPTTTPAAAAPVVPSEEEKEHHRSGGDDFVASSPDTVSPTVSLTAPLDAATVSGASVSLTATASDDVAVAGVQFKVDTSTNIGSEDTSSLYTGTWDSTGISDGSHTLIAVARDSAGNYATSSVATVTVDNTGPTLSSIASTTDITTATITWTTNEASDSLVDYGLTTSYGSATTSATMTTSHSLSISGLTAGTIYHYRIRSVDAQGNITTSSDQTFATGSVVSAAIRAQVPDGAGTLSGSNIAITWRTREKTNVTVSNPRIDFWNGWVDASVTTAAQEKGVGNVGVIRAALVTGISGTSLNQSSATLTQLTWTKAAAGTAGYLYKLDGTAASASDFTANGGLISGDGYQITIPNGYFASSDEATGLSITSGSSYFVQIENASGNTNKFPNSVLNLSSLGDARALTTSGVGTKVFAKDWSSGASLFSGTGENAFAIWGTGPTGRKVVATAGDSIIYGNQDSASGSTSITGDADGAIGFASRAFNSAGYSSVRTGISSTKASTVYTYSGHAMRLLALRYASAVISDMGHNDRGLPWAGSAGTGYQATYRWYWGQLRGALLGGTGRVVSTDLLPQVPSGNTTDSWATTAGQTSNTGSGTTQYDSINPFFAAGVFNTGLGDPDVAYLINSVLYSGAAANGFTDVDAGHIKWPANGTGETTTHSAATSDGTHPKGAVHSYIASDLATNLSTLLGF